MLSSIRDLADRLLRLPELRPYQGTGFDSPQATAAQRRLFETKKILPVLYQEYCRPAIESAGRAPQGARMVEIGSGTSPLKEGLPGLVCTDLVSLPWLDLVCSAYALPFADQSLDRLFLMFVCHHLGRIKDFLDEARRCLKPGGEMVIVDPAITRFSRFYYQHLHVDQMDLKTEEWGFEGQGRLSDSNVALTWLVFVRDRERFLREYPEFEMGPVEYNTCLTFLLAGGMRIRQLLPTAVLKGLFKLENWLIRRLSRQLAVTMALTLRRV
ncbi:MAG: class I SAM-dependent methyltransferase [Deltaproteobacteria bacterium]|nr:class I SAM-dependent methyltransferase [Deltaproteobacteria bacterium]